MSTTASDSHYVDGDMGISQWTVSGTMKSGERIRARGCDFYTFRGDKVVKKRLVLEDRREIAGWNARQPQGPRRGACGAGCAHGPLGDICGRGCA